MASEQGDQNKEENQRLKSEKEGGSEVETIGKKYRENGQQTEEEKYRGTAQQTDAYKVQDNWQQTEDEKEREEKPKEEDEDRKKEQQNDQESETKLENIKEKVKKCPCSKKYKSKKGSNSSQDYSMTSSQTSEKSYENQSPKTDSDSTVKSSKSVRKKESADQKPMALKENYEQAPPVAEDGVKQKRKDTTAKGTQNKTEQDNDSVKKPPRTEESESEMQVILNPSRRKLSNTENLPERQDSEASTSKENKKQSKKASDTSTQSKKSLSQILFFGKNRNRSTQTGIASKELILSDTNTQRNKSSSQTLFSRKRNRSTQTGISSSSVTVLRLSTAEEQSKLKFKPDVSVLKIEVENASQGAIVERPKRDKNSLVDNSDVEPTQLTRVSNKRPGSKKVKKKIKKANEELFKDDTN